jgi:hypothetical protein
MSISVKKITLWRCVVTNRPGALAEVLAPVAAAGADLQVVMGYRESGEPLKAAVEVYPVSGRKLTQAAEGAGLVASAIPAVLVSGTNRPGLGHRIAQAVADAGINLTFLVAQVVGRNHSAVLGFENDADATRAAAIVRKAVR